MTRQECVLIDAPKTRQVVLEVATGQQRRAPTEAELAFGVRLREIRKKHGEVQLNLANAIEVDPGNVSRWERAESMPDGASMLALLNHYRGDAEYLVFGGTRPELPESEAFEAFRKTTLAALLEERGLLDQVRAMAPPSIRATLDLYKSLAIALLSQDVNEGG